MQLKDRINNFFFMSSSESSGDGQYWCIVGGSQHVTLAKSNLLSVPLKLDKEFAPDVL